MLKFKQKTYKSMFRKYQIQSKYIKYYGDRICFINIYNINIKQVYSSILKIKKRFKKKKYYLYINCKNNYIQSYKSKNARMGKGKGALVKANIKHNSNVFGMFTNMSYHSKKIITKMIYVNCVI